LEEFALKHQCCFEASNLFWITSIFETILLWSIRTFYKF